VGYRSQMAIRRLYPVDAASDTQIVGSDFTLDLKSSREEPTRDPK